MRLRYALWFALGAGLVEAALLTAHGRLIHGFIYLSPHLVWMAPSANLFWFGAGLLVLTVLAAAVPALRTPRAALIAFGFLAALSILLIPSQLHRLAATLFALGIAVQGTRLVLPRIAAFDRIVSRTLPWMIALVVALGLGVFGWEAYRERRDLGRLPAPRAGAPNIVLLVLDTVRKASLSVYGYDRPTSPALERWARRGVRFDHAFTTASWTLPSHASMFTGQLPSAMSAGWLTPLDETHPVLGERLREQGYRTAGFVANILYCNRNFGLARGFIRYEDYRVTAGELVVNSSIGRALSESHWVRRLTGHYDILGRKKGATVTDRFLNWQRETEGPYFAFLNYFDAHQPYLPPADLASRFGPVTARDFSLLELRPYMGKIEKAETELTPEQVQAERNAYDATLAYLDGEVDRLLTELDRRGALANTVVIITSDHGEQFMEHGLMDHGNSLYRFATEVPLLLIGGPGVPAGAVVSTPVSLADLPATVMDLTGTGGRAFPGRSLRPGWTGNGEPAGPVVSETWGPGPIRRFTAVVADDYHAIWSADSAELYSLSADPEETTNLARTPGGPARLGALRTLLGSAIGRGPGGP